MSDSRRSGSTFGVPAPQDNLKRAKQQAFEALADQSPQQWRWLGAECAGNLWKLPVLSDVFQLDGLTRCLTTSSGAPVGPAWQILTLHYLGIRGRPRQQLPEITFADLPTARSYAGVYRQRTVARLCGSVGRSAEGLGAAAAAVGGRSVPGGDAAYDFDVFPRLAMRLIWHAADEEFPPSATLLLPANIESYLCAEDIVVLSECLVSRLCGRPF